ncbi:MAG TPA: ferric reductase-like transmembrane domain-containing protein [Gaiellaceae bacterium]|nr:ferric reductase-like transmembrane domain-containing protein [Gaiellaceae bacterium]
MTDAGLVADRLARDTFAPSRLALRRAAGLALVWAIVLGNAAAIVWLWIHGGNLHVRTTGDLLTSLARITGLVSAYTALIQVVLLARLPALERLVGFDRLSVWHRWNGHATFDLVVAHVFLSVWGYAELDRYSLGKEIRTMLGGGIYPGMITATVGTGLLVGVVGTSYVIVRRKLRYEWWYAVHLLAYAGIALAWFHQIPTGNELVLNADAADYWRALYLATLALLVVFRILLPLAGHLRHRLRVVEVVAEGPGVVSLLIEGRRLDRLSARPGQFFVWRFLTRGRWWAAHPFSLSAAPDGRSLRITVKALGDHSGSLADVPVGTRVLADGPFGVFTADARRREKLLLIAGGIGVTPIRALLEELRGDVVVLYRALSEEDLVLRDELHALAARHGFALHEVVGDHRTEDGARLLSAEHLHELVPDLVERDVFLCGPPGLADAVGRQVRRAGVPRRHLHAERFAL